MPTKTSLPLSDYGLGLIYLLLILGLTYFVAVLDQPKYALGPVTFLMSLMFTLLGNLTNRLIIAKFLPPLAIIGILTLMVMPGWGTPKFREGDVHELFVVRASAAIALCLIISLAGFRIGIAAFGNFIRKDKPIPPPVARVRTLIIILVLLAPVAWLFFSYEEPQERFSLLAAGGLICLIVLYDAAFTHILHMEAQKRLANKPDEAEDVVVDFELIDNDKEEADTPNAD